MRKKINGEAGFTLVEMLLATAVMVLLAMMMSTGIQLALRSYRALTAHAEAELLLTTAVDAIADDLRYAWDVDPKGTGTPGPDGTTTTYKTFTYTSSSFGPGISLKKDETTGQIVAETDSGNKRVLPAGTYGEGEKYTVESMEIRLVKPAASPGELVEVTFIIELTVTDGNVSASTPDGGVTVRCLNKMKVT